MLNLELSFEVLTEISAKLRLAQIFTADGNLLLPKVSAGKHLNSFPSLLLTITTGLERIKFLIITRSQSATQLGESRCDFGKYLALA